MTQTTLRLATILVLGAFLLTFGMTNQVASAVTATFTNNTPGFVDRSTDIRTVTVTTAEIPAGDLITDVDVIVDFEKEGNNDCAIPDGSSSFSNEISMSLTSPSGTLVNLVFDQSGQSPTYTNSGNADRVVVTFDDSATILVGTTNNGLPQTGTFQPAQPLSAFNGENPQGIWTFTYGDDVGADFLCFNQLDVTITTESPNEAPDCSEAIASQETIWPPNHKFVAISVDGVTDPDGDSVSITIDGIFQDELVDAKGSGETSPDGIIDGDTAEVRAERSGLGDGRVYEISFTADDGNGGSCTGSVIVGVPHDKKDTPVDSGDRFASTVS